MSDTLNISSRRIPPKEEATTAAALYAIAEKLALSDEPGSSNMAIEISRRADILAKLEIKIRTDEYKIRTDEYTSIKPAIDTATDELKKNILQVMQARELVQKAREIAVMVDTLIRLSDQGQSGGVNIGGTVGSVGGDIVGRDKTVISEVNAGIQPGKAVPASEKHISVWISECSEGLKQPLQVGQAYTLNFKVGQPVLSSLVSGPATEIPSADIPQALLRSGWLYPNP